jgi:nuclear pore complex protein Nup205
MAGEDSLRRLQILQRDLAAFTENRLPNVERLAVQLDASADDLKRLLARNKKNEQSRAVLAPNTNPQPTTIKIDNVEYRIQEQFRQDALLVADELDLDEMEAAKLCIEAPPVDLSIADTTQALRALLRFHDRRQTLLDCLRMILHLSLELDHNDEMLHDTAGIDLNDIIDERSAAFKVVAREIIQGGDSGGQAECSAFWRKCIDGLTDIESYIKKVVEHKQKVIMTGQSLEGDIGDALQAQRLSLTYQHECLSTILAHLVEGSYVQAEDYRVFLNKAAATETDIDIAFHYIPIIVCGAKTFATNPSMTIENGRDLHALFATGPAQLQWKLPNFKSAATVLWLAEYNARFSTTSIDQSQSEADRKKGEEARAALFFDALKERAFHFLLSAASFFRPIVWYEPSRAGITDFLVDLAPAIPAVAIPPDVPRASEAFATTALREIQAFTGAFVENMPDTLRRLRTEEDEKRRNHLSQPLNGPVQFDMDLERFIVIMACAFHDDVDATQEFWADKESSLYGFLRWVSQRLPTPRVAAFCQLLRSIACDDASANNAHRFLLDDIGMASAKLGKAYAVSWKQIFNELELYASTLRNQPALPHLPGGQNGGSTDNDLTEPETGIMLDAYLGLAAHICRTSPEARNWLLKDQPFHLGKTMIELIKTDVNARIKACCLDMLSALLTDKVLEVRNGVWVLIDSWVSGAEVDASVTRPKGRPKFSAKQYLEIFAENAEAGAAFVGLLNALVAPVGSTEITLDMLPFPEHLGAPNRHPGIDTYVDFVMHSVFAQKVMRLYAAGEEVMIDLLRFACLEFAHTCLASFNENLVLLANFSDVGIETAMETKSLVTYARLHPFARVMEWLFDKAVLQSLFLTIQRSNDRLDDAHPGSPLVQSTIRAIQLLNIAWDLQPTYFNVVRRTIATQASRRQPASISTLSSVDEIFLSQLSAVADVAKYTTSQHTGLSLESISLMHKIGSSRKLSQTVDAGVERMHRGNRIIGALTHLSTALTLELRPVFAVEQWDLESDRIPSKLVKAKALLDLLNSSIDSAGGRPSLAHSLLGFNCYERFLDILPNGAFASGASLFHAIAICAANDPIAINNSNTSWLLGIKRGCLSIVLKLLLSTLTTHIVQPELRAMEFQAALSRNQCPASEIPLWDQKQLHDPNVLLDSSATAIVDFMHIRELYFELCASDLRNASDQGSFSVQERVMGSLLGTIKLPTGEQVATVSVFDLVDFFELETTTASDVNCTLLADVDMSVCTKEISETISAYDVRMAEELLLFRKRELLDKGAIADMQQIDDEIRAILASLTSQNNWSAIQTARLDALEAWTDLMSLVVSKGGLKPSDIVAFSLQGLLIVLPKLEKSLTENLDAAALMAKVTLTLTQVIGPASLSSSQQTANVTAERLLATYRVALKALTDSSTDLTLRDCCYRICCAVLAAQSAESASAKASPALGSRQLLKLTQNCGERLMTVITEDAFSGRGITRVSALLFLDSLVSLFQVGKASASMLRGLSKLNFVPVLLDSSIGAIVSAFRGEAETQTSLAYFHTAFAFLLKICHGVEGIQLVIHSGFFETIDESRLFASDVDDETVPALYTIMAAVLRVVTAIVVGKGAQPALTFLNTYRRAAISIFKSASKGEQSVVEVSEEYSKLFLFAGFLVRIASVLLMRMN